MSANLSWRRWMAGIAGGAILWVFWEAQPPPSDPNVVAHFIHALTFGWLEFAKRIFPEVTVAVSPIALALLVSVAIGLLLYLAGRNRWGWTWRTPLALVCAPGILFAIVLSAAGIHSRVVEIGLNAKLEAHYLPWRLPPEIRDAKFDKNGAP